MFRILEADIVVMQETKIQRKDLVDDMVLVPGWDVFFSLPKHKKGEFGKSLTDLMLNIYQAILVLQYTLETQFVLQFVLRKASLVSSPNQTHQQATSTCQRINKSVAILHLFRCRNVLWTRRLSILRVVVLSWSSLLSS